MHRSLVQLPALVLLTLLPQAVTARSADIRTNMHQPQVTIRGESAWITYDWTDEAESRLTGDRETSRDKSTRIFVREGGRWLCIHGHYTLVQ